MLTVGDYVNAPSVALAAKNVGAREMKMRFVMLFGKRARGRCRTFDGACLRIENPSPREVGLGDTLCGEDLHTDHERNQH
jgi:hypothetical protein